MELLGTVAEILNETVILVKAEKAVDVGDILKVFSEIKSNTLSEKYQLPHVYVPKGEVRILAKQNDDYYLAETFRELVESGKVVEKPSSLLTGIWGSEILREKVWGPSSANLSPPTAPIEIPNDVMVGDRIGKD